ncbi:MAG TPA: glycosyl hydrolase family protein [Bacteroides sp.]|nr:glycosyl hydrolase family protein [Bacteroides sp.]
MGIPATAKIESEEAALVKGHKEFKAYKKSDELARFEELDKIVNISEFTGKVKAIKSQKFKDTEEYKKEREYLSLKKSKDIKTYFKVKESRELEEYKQTDKSDDLKKYEELAQYVNSGEFTSARQSAGKKYKGTDAHQKEQEYRSLKKSATIKKYFKFKSSAKLKTYQEVKGSERLSRLKELEEATNSEEFKKVKEYMALKSKAKYEQSKEFELEKEYLELKKSEKLIWYQKLEKKNDFDKLKEWEITFEDDFKEGSLDTGKWMTNYYWGEKLLKDTYALPGDKHFYTKGRNIEISDSVLKIVTKKEQASGKVWDPVLGFKNREFDYTSGLISTGKSFRQQYGRVRAKIRMSGAPVRQAMWMASDKILPHVDVAKVEKGKIFYGNFWGNIAEKGGVHKKVVKKGAGKFTSDFFIYSIEWSPEKIVWKINEKVVLTQTKGIPQDPLYLVFSSGVSNGIGDHQLPATMEVDWVRIYKKPE